MTIKELVKICYNIAKEHGWWDCPKCEGKGHVWSQTVCSGVDDCPICNGTGQDNRNNGELIALMHSELSEALQEYRQLKPNKDKVALELADCIIRIADFAGGRGIDLEKAILNKIETNKKRPYKHNKAF